MSTPLRRSTRVRAISGPATSTANSPPSDSDRPRKRVKVNATEAQDATLMDMPLSAKVKKAPARKTKYSGPLHPDGYAARIQSAWKAGAHVSAAGGVENAILNAASIGANSFALFVKSQRKWTSPSLSSESIEAFKSRLLEFNYSPDHVLPHGSYLINLGNPDKEKREKSYECFVDDLKRCELLGLTRYNFHPGSTAGEATKGESIDLIAACINRAHQETSSVVTVIENMAGSGNVLGSKFEEIGSIIDKVKDKSRVGVCVDTCHMFAAGYDIRFKEAYESTISEFDRLVGLKYLRGMHLNDSKTDFASGKDRHHNLGQGYISLAAFGYIMRDHRLQNIPLILETPIEDDTSIWEKEIKVLNDLSEIQSDDEGTLAKYKDEIAQRVKTSAKDGKVPKKTSKRGGEGDVESE